MLKKLYILSLFLLFAGSKLLAQNVIMAKDAYKHVGEMVTVRDSVYFGKVYNDSTAVVELGNRKYIAPLTVVFSADRNPKLADPYFVSDYLQRRRISVSGFVMLVKGHPTIFVTRWNDLKVDEDNSNVIAENYWH